MSFVKQEVKKVIPSLKELFVIHVSNNRSNENKLVIFKLHVCLVYDKSIY